MTDITAKKWYKVSKPKPDGRLNTCGMRLVDGQETLLYVKTADEVAQLNALQDYGYTVKHEVRNPKKKARPAN